MGLEDVLIYKGIKIRKGDKIKIIGDEEHFGTLDKEGVIGYFYGMRKDGLVYISSKKDLSNWDSAYNIANYKIIKLD